MEKEIFWRRRYTTSAGSAERLSEGRRTKRTLAVWERQKSKDRRRTSTTWRHSWHPDAACVSTRVHCAIAKTLVLIARSRRACDDEAPGSELLERARGSQSGRPRGAKPVDIPAAPLPTNPAAITPISPARAARACLGVQSRPPLALASTRALAGQRERPPGAQR